MITFGDSWASFAVAEITGTEVFHAGSERYAAKPRTDPWRPWRIKVPRAWEGPGRRGGGSRAGRSVRATPGRGKGVEHVVDLLVVQPQRADARDGTIGGRGATQVAVHAGAGAQGGLKR